MWNCRWNRKICPGLTRIFWQVWFVIIWDKIILIYWIQFWLVLQTFLTIWRWGSRNFKKIAIAIGHKSCQLGTILCRETGEIRKIFEAIGIIDDDIYSIRITRDICEGLDFPLIIHCSQLNFDLVILQDQQIYRIIIVPSITVDVKTIRAFLSVEAAY